MRYHNKLTIFKRTTTYTIDYITQSKMITLRQHAKPISLLLQHQTVGTFHPITGKIILYDLS